MDLKETAINYIAGDSEITVYTAERRYINTVKRLIESKPDQIRIVRENPDGSIIAKMPTEWFRFPKPKRTISDEMKAAAAERMRERWGSRDEV